MSRGGLVKTSLFRNPTYIGDPINTIKILNDKRVDELIILNIDSVYGEPADLKLLAAIANEARMPLTYGGGVSSVGQATEIISLGFEKISIGRLIHRDRELIKAISQRPGRQSLVASLDIKRIAGVPKVFTNRGEDALPCDYFDLCTFLQSEGVGEVLINCIDREGLMGGYDLELVKATRSVLNIPFTINGGCGAAEHMKGVLEVASHVGLGAGSFFVFKGKYRSVLITYTRP
jgi:imidazole glycerol-phosphate synthase subunit HisF